MKEKLDLPHLIQKLNKISRWQHPNFAFADSSNRNPSDRTHFTQRTRHQNQLAHQTPTFKKLKLHQKLVQIKQFLMGLNTRKKIPIVSPGTWKSWPQNSGRCKIGELSEISKKFKTPFYAFQFVSMILICICSKRKKESKFVPFSLLFVYLSWIYHKAWSPKPSQSHPTFLLKPLWSSITNWPTLSPDLPVKPTLSPATSGNV